MFTNSLDETMHTAGQLRAFCRGRAWRLQNPVFSKAILMDKAFQVDFYAGRNKKAAAQHEARTDEQEAGLQYRARLTGRRNYSISSRLLQKEQ